VIDVDMVLRLLHVDHQTVDTVGTDGRHLERSTRFIRDRIERLDHRLTVGEKRIDRATAGIGGREIRVALTVTAARGSARTALAGTEKAREQ
jgi:hypothetical protein